MKEFYKKLSSLLVVLFLTVCGCQKELNWRSMATGSLKDSTGVCYPAEISGTFYNSVTPGKDTAYIELKVDVFTTGFYSIITDLQNGLRFADSGTFNTKGLHIIKLKPVGIPVEPVTSRFTVCFDNSCCQVDLDVKYVIQNETDPVNSWSYTDTKKGITYSGPINATHFLITPISALLALRKEVTQRTDTSFEIGLSFPSGKITTGRFTTDTLNEVALSANGICVNCAWEVMYKFYSVITTIVVTDYDPATKIIKGTFEGTTIDGSNQVAPIKDGTFSAVVK